jgi:hypothetical protein
MIYIEYEELIQAQRRTLKAYEAVLEEQERLFELTQPQGVDYGGDRVQSSPTSTAIDRYVEAKERAGIDRRKAELSQVMQEREVLIALKKSELYASQSLDDKVYRWRAIDRLKVPEIARKAHYTTRQIYRTIRRIQDRIRKMSQNVTNDML